MGRASRRALAWAAHAGAVRVRAEDRRAGDEPALRAVAVRPGGDPRRRPGRRGRHRQRGHDRRASRSGSPGRACPRCSRSAARSTCRSPASRRSTNGRMADGRAAVRQPAQRRRRAAFARRTRRSPPAASWRSGAISSARSSAGPTFTGHHETLEFLADLGFPVNPEIRVRRLARRGRGRSASHWQEHRHDLRYEIDGAVVKVDDLAQRELLGFTSQGAAVGDRLQVPPGGAHDDAPRHPGLDRPHRPGDAVRRARAGLRRRLDGRDGDAAQRGPGPAEGRPPRRHRRRPQGR